MILFMKYQLSVLKFHIVFIDLVDLVIVFQLNPMLSPSSAIHYSKIPMLFLTFIRNIKSQPMLAPFENI
jgi:hypothetical protein